jgi:hypothetical protein
MKNVQVRIVSNQKEEITSDRPASEEEKKAFLFKHYPEMYKKMYPDTVIEKPKSKPKPNIWDKNPHVKRNGENDLGKSNNIYVKDKYTSADFGNGNSLNIKINIKTDMEL